MSGAIPILDATLEWLDGAEDACRGAPYTVPATPAISLYPDDMWIPLSAASAIRMLIQAQDALLMITRRQRDHIRKLEEEIVELGKRPPVA